jgi:hypothetical protein
MEAAERAIPGGAHTYAKGDDQYPEGLAPVIDHGLGCRVFDIDGNEYVEYGSGLRAVTLGHGHPAVLESVRSALDLGVNFTRPHRLALTAAERLLELFPGADMVKFGVHGSDVTSGAVRLARGYTGRELVAVCSDHPFFSTGDWFIATTPMSAGIPQPVRDLTVGFHYNDLASLQRQLEAHPGQIAAVVLEAEASEPPAPGFLPGIRRLCVEHGVILILDEVITGFRWDLRGAQHIYDIRPDLFTLAKGLPLSALLGRRELMELGGFCEEARPGVAAVDELWRPAVGAERDDDGDRHLRERGRHGAAPRRGRRAAAGLRSRNCGPRAARPRADRRTGLQPRLRHPRRQRTAQSGLSNSVLAGAAEQGSARAELRGEPRPRRRGHRAHRRGGPAGARRLGARAGRGAARAACPALQPPARLSPDI